MSEAILHIGMPKTGSTALQGFFLRNRRLLAQEGVDYPILRTISPRANKSINGNMLVSYLVESRHDVWPRLFRRNVKKLEELASKPHARVLLSEENIYIGDIDVIRGFLADRGFDRVKVIGYVRRQDDWLISSWKQGCEGGYRAVPFSNTANYTDVRNWLSYGSRYEQIARALQPQDRVIVRRYAKGSFVGGDIFRDFCSAADIPWRGDFSMPGRLNPSVTCDVAEAMIRICQKGFPGLYGSMADAYRRMNLLKIAEEYSAEHPEAKGTFPATPEWRRDALERYRAENEKLSERYFDGEPLFDMTVDDSYPVWEPDEARAEKIESELMDRYNKKIETVACRARLFYLEKRYDR